MWAFVLHYKLFFHKKDWGGFRDPGHPSLRHYRTVRNLLAVFRKQRLAFPDCTLSRKNEICVCGLLYY